MSTEQDARTARRLNNVTSSRDRRDRLAKQRYIEDCERRPNYPDGTKRKPWEQLDDTAQWSWGRV